MLKLYFELMANTKDDADKLMRWLEDNGFDIERADWEKEDGESGSLI